MATAPENPGPQLQPPTAAGVAAIEAGRPSELDTISLAEAERRDADGAPSLAPPTETAAAAAAAVTAVTAWQQNKTVAGLWHDAASRNSWASFAGMGWRKVNDVNDSSTIAITQMLAHARATGVVVNFLEGADGKIHEVYVW